MTKKLMLLLMITTISSTFFAQGQLGPISITHGKEIKTYKEKIVRIAGESGGKIFTLATKGKEYYIKVFNSSDMALVSTKKVEMADFKDKEPLFEDISVINNRVYILGSVYDKKTKMANLLAAEVDEKGSLTSNKKKLFSTAVTKSRERGGFYFKSSPSNDKLLIMHAAFFEKKEEIQYEIKLVDENLDIVAEHLEKVPFTDRKGLEFTIADFDVNVNDDVFLVINESYRDKKAKTNHEKLEVHAFKASNNYSKEIIDIKFTDKEIINCQMLANRNNQMQLVGFYSSVRANGKANKELKGVYSAAIDVNSNTVTGLKFNEFDYETKVKLLGERRAKKGKDVKPLYLPHSIIEKSDGGLILLSEYKLVIVGKSSGIGPFGLTPITHINKEIIVTSLNPDGSVAWTNVIAKDQKASFTALSIGFGAVGGNASLTVTASVSIPLSMLGKGPEYLSAMPIYENGQLTVVFNDNLKNIGVTDIEEIKSLGNYNKAIPTAFVFHNETGDITRIDPEELHKEQLILRPGVFYRKSAKEYIIYSSRKSEDKLGRLYIE